MQNRPSKILPRDVTLDPTGGGGKLTYQVLPNDGQNAIPVPKAEFRRAGENMKESTRHMIELYEGGLTMEQIGRRFGVIKQTVQKRLARVFVTRRLKYKSIDPAELLRLYTQDLSLSVIAGAFKTSPQVIKQALDFHRVPKRIPIKLDGPYADILRVLEIGRPQQIEINSKTPQALLHRSAANVGIKIKMRRVTGNNFKVEKIADN